jgi:hypothetical protein
VEVGAIGDAPKKRDERDEEELPPQRERFNDFKTTVIGDSLIRFLDETRPSRHRFDRGKLFAYAGLEMLETKATDEERVSLKKWRDDLDEIRLKVPTLHRGPDNSDVMSLMLGSGDSAHQEIPRGNLMAGLQWADEHYAHERLEELSPIVIAIARVCAAEGIIPLDFVRATLGLDDETGEK